MLFRRPFLLRLRQWFAGKPARPRTFSTIEARRMLVANVARTTGVPVNARAWRRM